MNKPAPQRSAFSITIQLLLAMILLGPVLILCVYAFSTRWFYPDVLPKIWSFEPGRRLFETPYIAGAIATSLLTAGITTVLALVIALPAAAVLGMQRFVGRSLVITILFLPNVLPPLMIGMGLNILFLQLGLAGSLFGVVLVHLVPVIPYTIVSLIGVFERYDTSYTWQARSLGASWFGSWRLVGIPLLWPGVVVAALFAFLVSWSQYLLTLLIGGGQVITLPILLFATVAGGNATTTALLALLFALPPVIAIGLAVRVFGHDPRKLAQHY
jgi:putative spermidine/putrescine transport system permease protein